LNILAYIMNQNVIKVSDITLWKKLRKEWMSVLILNMLVPTF